MLFIVWPPTLISYPPYLYIKVEREYKRHIDGKVWQKSNTFISTSLQSLNNTSQNHSIESTAQKQSKAFSRAVLGVYKASNYFTHEIHPIARNNINYWHALC